jgi:hypothetical protein
MRCLMGPPICRRASFESLSMREVDGLRKQPRYVERDVKRDHGSAPDRICLNRCAPPPSGNAPSQNLIDAAAIEIDDLETPALMIKAFADGRQVTELIEN